MNEKMCDLKLNGLLGAGEPLTTPELEETEGSMKKVSSTSRFQVARVDFAENVDTKDAEPDTNHSNHDNKNKETDGNHVDIHRDSMTHRDSINAYIDTTSPNATYQSVNATTNHKTFGKYTTEALPHMDHYRNLLSATNALKSRPTLAELHEEKVNSKDFLLILEAWTGISQ